MTSYESTKISEKIYEIKTLVAGNPVEFIVCVGESESEVPALVEHHLSAISSTPQTYSQTYAQKRASEYPPITDYIDGVVKSDQAQIDKYIADCLAVKAKYPKQGN